MSSASNSILQSGTASSAAAEGVGARRSATKSAMVKSVSCPIAEITGKLIINPVKKVTDGDTGSTKEAASYTSGRVSTQNKQTFIYGRFECRAKVPKGHGYLPAFTLS